NDTMRILYMYNENDPPHGFVKLGKLPDPASSFRPYRPMLLTQRSHISYRHMDHVRILELRNEDVEMPRADDTLIWCKMFKLDDLKHKHHLIRYEPIYDSPSSVHYLQHITLRECHGMHQELEMMAREQGRQCMGARDIPLACNAIVASWSHGSNMAEFEPPVTLPLPHSSKQQIAEMGAPIFG
uniref:Copper type II ascorbate-dependent monooxygenase N-terminal domain-containing protein n=1 Tax=Stomoxys calcitrans TaxID=35570 RepID=A0A1I8Q8K7_STOCA